MDISNADFLGKEHERYSVEKMRDKWLSNIRANRKHFIKEQYKFKGMVYFIIGAGPSLKKNAEELRRIPKNSRGIIVASDIALPYLFENDIVPDICVSLDGKDVIWDMINSSKKVDTSKVVLYCSITVSPKLTDNWKGPKHFFLQRGNAFTKQLSDEMYMTSRILKTRKELKNNVEIGMEDLEVVYSGIPPTTLVGGNVTSAALHWAIAVMKAWKTIFVGLDLSWKEDKEFYVNKMFHKHSLIQANSDEKWLHKDIYNNDIFTNTSLLKFKKWHEEYALTYPNYVVNSTEGGIFGINNDGSKLDGIEFLTLNESIDKYIY